MRKIDAALFDIDGTLLDTTEFVYQAFVHTFQVHGLTWRSTGEIAAVMGKPWEECYRPFSASENISELCETQRSFQAQNLHLSPLPEYARDAEKIERRWRKNSCRYDSFKRSYQLQSEQAEERIPAPLALRTFLYGPII